MGQMRLCFQLFVVGYLICTCGSTTLDSDKVLDGRWVLKDRSSATLLCTISPFTGALIWRFNYIKVAECTLKYCRQFSTGDGAFMFGFDTENGFFEFTINPVDKKKHNGKIIQCYDGIDTINVTASVTESEEIQTGAGNASTHDPLVVAILVIVAIFACIFGAGVVIFVIKKFAWKKCKKGLQPTHDKLPIVEDINMPTAAGINDPEQESASSDVDMNKLTSRPDSDGIPPPKLRSGSDQEVSDGAPSKTSDKIEDNPN